MHRSNHDTRLHVLHSMASIMLALLFWIGTPASGQSTPAQTTPSQSMPSQDNDTKGWQIADMDKFLDSHPEIEEQLRKDPSLIRNDEFVEKHPALQQYLQEHPGIREEFTENPNAFMRQEQRYERREDSDGRNRNGDRDITREQLATMDRFMDSHPEIAEQLRKDPSLINDKQFVENHPALQEFLQSHPGVREEFSENPNAFMRREERFDRREGDRDDHRIAGDRDRNLAGDRDVTREELATTDRFLDTHPEIAEQLRKDPSLIKNKVFVENHPALQDFLQTHSEIREEFRENPNAFMRREERFDQREDSRNRATTLHDRDRDDLASFGQFLGGHSTLAQQLAKDPSLANNKEFLSNHTELQDYLKAHPEVRQQLATNPQGVISTVTPPPSTVLDPKLQPKPKQ